MNTRTNTPHQAHEHLIPAAAQAVAFAYELDALLELIQHSYARLPLSHRALAGGEGSGDLLFEFDPKHWGIDASGFATFFYAEGFQTLIVALKDTASFQESLGRLGEQIEWKATRSMSGKYHFLRIEQTQHADDGLRSIIEIAHNDQIAVLAVRHTTHAASKSDDRSGIARWLKLPAKDQWSQAFAQRHLINELHTREGVYGVMDASSWLPAASENDHARILNLRLKQHLAVVGFKAYYDSVHNTVRTQLRMPGDVTMPKLIDDLGMAKGAMPQVTGLIHPGLLGLIRISVDPHKFYELIRSTLPASQRLEIDQLINQLQADLLIDLQGQVLENWTGHALVVLYGIERQYFDPTHTKFWANLSQFKATREAILFPITDRAAMQRLLDIMTQMSKGKLRRQTARHTMQYAWIDDDTLQWAIILHDEYVIIVDSAVALDHATYFDRSPRQLSEHLKSLNVDRLVDTQIQSGFYLDMNSAALILEEMGHSELATWFSPFQAIVLRTEVEHDEEVIHVDWTLKGRLLPAAEESSTD